MLCYTWADPSHQQETHALSGGAFATEYKNTFDDIIKADARFTSVLGTLLHRFGDVYAHSHLSGDGKMYGNSIYTIEHKFATEPDGSDTGLRPDMISGRPELYKEYVSGLTSLMMNKFGKTERPDLSILSNLADYASKNKVSLIGILNYEVANKQGLSEFSIQYGRGNFMVTDIDAHINNTKKYLNSKKIKYTTSKDYIKDGDESIYVGTTFKIKK